MRTHFFGLPPSPLHWRHNSIYCARIWRTPSPIAACVHYVWPHSKYMLIGSRVTWVSIGRLCVTDNPLRSGPNAWLFKGWLIGAKGKSISGFGIVIFWSQLVKLNLESAKFLVHEKNPDFYSDSLLHILPCRKQHMHVILLHSTRVDKQPVKKRRHLWFSHSHSRLSI